MDRSPQIELDNDTDEETMRVLLKIGFVKSRGGDLEQRWKAYSESIVSKREKHYQELSEKNAAIVEEKVKKFENDFPIWIARQISRFYT
jgi:hypothetical protein